MVEHPKSKSTKPSLRGHGTPCSYYDARYDVTLAVTLFFAMQVLQSLDLAFEKFIESVGQMNRQPSAHIIAGLVLCSLTKRANAFLGGLLVVEYLVDLGRDSNITKIIMKIIMKNIKNR